MHKAIFFAIALASSVPGVAAASSTHPRECIMTVGPNWLTLSAMQPQAPHDTFCNHLPNAGPTVLILDTEQLELREMLMEVRILRDVGQKAWQDNLEANTVLLLPSKKYLRGKGTFSFDYNFGGDGHYIALVRAVSEDGTREYVGQFGFSVGETLVFYLSLVTLAAAFCFLAFGIWKKDLHTSTPERPRRLQGDSVAPPDEIHQTGNPRAGL